MPFLGSLGPRSFAMGNTNLRQVRFKLRSRLSSSDIIVSVRSMPSTCWILSSFFADGASAACAWRAPSRAGAAASRRSKVGEGRAVGFMDALAADLTRDLTVLRAQKSPAVRGLIDGADTRIRRAAIVIQVAGYPHQGGRCGRHPSRRPGPGRWRCP